MHDASHHAQFRVALRDLPAHRTVEVGPDYVGSVLQGMPMRDAAADVPAGRGALDVDVYAEGANVHASGTMRGEIVVACSRCVGPARIAIDEDVQATFMPAAELETDEETGEKAPAANGHAVTADDGVELDAEDLDVYPYEGEHVDLEPILREQLVLAVPFAPLCREDCKGLCPQCGVDLNVDPSHACEKPVDPRFAALKGLKLPS